MITLLTTRDPQDNLMPSGTSISKRDRLRDELKMHLAVNATQQHSLPSADHTSNAETSDVHRSHRRGLDNWLNTKTFKEFSPIQIHVHLALDSWLNVKEILEEKIPHRVMVDFAPIPVAPETIARSMQGRTTENAVSWAKPIELAPDPEVLLVDSLRRLFHDSDNEVFEDGMSNEFSANLHLIIRNHGAAAVKALEHLVHKNDANIEAAEEALRQMGRIDHKSTHRHRLSLLKRALESRNSRIRDAASIGIEALEDPSAIRSLQRAIEKEQSEQLRQNFRDVLEQLQDSR